VTKSKPLKTAPNKLAVRERHQPNISQFYICFKTFFLYRGGSLVLSE
jgi:hypothetical protein